MVSSVSSRRKRYLKHYNASTWTQSSSVLVIPKNKAKALFRQGTAVSALLSFHNLNMEGDGKQSPKN
eukprot:1151115-Pelagomonas_calceolata.AAC.4